jgi:hypothetical protein
VTSEQASEALGRTMIPKEQSFLLKPPRGFIEATDDPSSGWRKGPEGPVKLSWTDKRPP